MPRKRTFGKILLVLPQGSVTSYIVRLNHIPIFKYIFLQVLYKYKAGRYCDTVKDN